MILVTGDTHGDFRRFSTSRFPLQKEMTKSDFVIICGDFGGVWKDSPEERYWLDWLNDKPFTTLFVDGNHECFDRLNHDFPLQMFAGGQVHWVRSNILHLMRGEVYEIEGKKFFTFGGASSHDIRDGILDPADYDNPKDFKRDYNLMVRIRQQFRVKGVSWWPEELPSDEEMQHGIDTLAEHDNKVNYVITHCLPQEVASTFSMGLYKSDKLTMYFNSLLRNGLQFDHWFCGHYHVDRRIMGKFDVLYENFIMLGDDGYERV